jgi:hypothetical protein
VAKYEASVNTKFGEIVVNFDSVEDLKASIENLDTSAVSDVVMKKFESIMKREVREPKPGFEGIYRFTPSGMAELIRIPDNKAKTVALVLYAYHPEPASIEQISLSSGIKDVIDYLTHASYRKYWSKVQEAKYVLSQEGLEWVTGKIVDEFKVNAERTESKSP